MADFTIKEARKSFFELLPNGATLSWEEILRLTGRYRKQIEGLAFGKPDHITRTGYDYVASGRVTAEKRINFFLKLHSAAEVRFTVSPKGDKFYVKNVTGLTLYAGPLPIAITDFGLDIDASGHFAITSHGFTAVVNDKSELINFKLA